MIEHVDKSLNFCLKQALRKLKSFNLLSQREDFKKFFDENPICIYDKEFSIKGNYFYINEAIYINKNLTGKEKEYFILKAIIEMYFEETNKYKLTKIELRALSSECLEKIYRNNRDANIDVRDILTYARFVSNGINVFPLDIYLKGKRLECDDNKSLKEVFSHLENFENDAQQDMFLEAYDDLLQAQRGILESNVERLTSSDTFTYIYLTNKLKEAPIEDDEFINEYIVNMNKKYISKRVNANETKQKELEEELRRMQVFAKSIVDCSKYDKDGRETDKLRERFMWMIKSFELDLKTESKNRSKR